MKLHFGYNVIYAGMDIRIRMDCGSHVVNPKIQQTQCGFVHEIPNLEKLFIIANEMLA